MTREQFRAWATNAARIFAKDGARCGAVSRNFAEEIRPHDPVLADLYVAQAEGNERIRAHLVRRAG